jgi:hypothetical protein
MAANDAQLTTMPKPGAGPYLRGTERFAVERSRQHTERNSACQNNEEKQQVHATWENCDRLFAVEIGSVLSPDK